jgi:pectin methylesterase-like acyl-CoA thioesterase
MTLSDTTKRNRAWSLTLSSTICSLIILFAGAVAQAKVLDLCVDPGGADGCSTTIQAAVDLVPAKHSAVITIVAGTYPEDVAVTNKTVSFIGAIE